MFDRAGIDILHQVFPADPAALGNSYLIVLCWVLGGAMKISLTDREADVMQVLWDIGPSVVNDVQSRLGIDLERIKPGAPSAERPS